MSRSPILRRAALLLLAALLFTACGGDDSSSSGNDDTSAEDAVAQDDGGAAGDTDGANAEDDGAGGETTGTCGGNDAQFTNLITGESVMVTSAAAAGLEGGAAYTVYLADFELDASALSFVSTPTAMAGQNLITVPLTIFNATEPLTPLAPDTVIPYTDDFGVLTFRVTHQVGEGEYYGSNLEAAGSVTLTGVGGSVCFDIDYVDSEKALTGTIEAPVKMV